ncbi:hypothetical protein GRF59_08610 [Paenibacillus sp. HJL G12]|uniref:Heparin-sulfate lyase N-terminal domain-containing protein n=1 Tax=Paenibacillus dendrobii TaxID=2691084 RepID=A0A7X3IKH9_9BACL|nr:alginate lyase family protein [Paenibacillus dendrobii]MWV43697.1 hypothetical protein [Paenibacillus dendrobii]
MATGQVQIKRLMAMPLRAAVKKIAGKAIQEARFAYRQYRISRSPIMLQPELFHSFESHMVFSYESPIREHAADYLREEGLDGEIIRDADRICAHIFNLLGSGDKNLGPFLPWSEDFKTGYRWENKYYQRIAIVNLDDAADVKVPWELSRFQHFFTLGKAYALTGNEKYAREFQTQLEDWMLKNPVEMSVNWTCAMDVAIRAANWIAVVPFFLKSLCIPDFFWDRFHACLYLHGAFIRSNLERTGEHTGNHYAADLAGLIALGLYFGGNDVQVGRFGETPREWLHFGMAELEKELFVQVNEDGTNYEASTSYHRLVAEIFLITTVWCSNNGISFSERYMKRLESMHEFLLNIMKPDGRSPLVGDADDGRYLIVSRYGNWVRSDFRHLLAVAGEFFNRDDFRSAGRGSAEDALWIIGGIKPHTKSRMIGMKSAAFPDGGYYILRSAQAYCLIRCGENSFHGHGAHSHNDQLSFELHVKGKDILVDPGSYVYSADFRARNLFRSTAMHNTLQIGELEQNDIEERNLFLLREQTFAASDSFTEHRFSGSHQGYLEKVGFIHRRQLELEQTGLVIFDTLEQAVPNSDPVTSAFVTFLLAPDVRITGHMMNWLLESGDCKLSIDFDGAGEVQLQYAWISASYGTRVRTRLLRAYIRNRCLKTNIRWV